jgi:hypothetical protein
MINRLDYKTKNGSKGLLLAGLLAIALPNAAQAAEGGGWRDYLRSLSWPQFSMRQVRDSLLNNYDIVLSAVAVVAGLSLLWWNQSSSGSKSSVSGTARKPEGSKPGEPKVTPGAPSMSPEKVASMKKDIEQVVSELFDKLGTTNVNELIKFLQQRGLKATTSGLDNKAFLVNVILQQYQNGSLDLSKHWDEFLQLKLYGQKNAKEFIEAFKNFPGKLEAIVTKHAQTL